MALFACFTTISFLFLQLPPTHAHAHRNQRRDQVEVTFFPAIEPITEILENSSIDAFDVATYQASTIYSVGAKRANGDSGNWDQLLLHVTTYPSQNRQVLTYVPNFPTDGGGIITTTADCTIIPSRTATCATGGLGPDADGAMVTYGPADFDLYTTFVVTGSFDGTVSSIGGGAITLDPSYFETLTRTPKPTTVTKTTTGRDEPTSGADPSPTRPADDTDSGGEDEPEPTEDRPPGVTVIDLSTTVTLGTNIPTNTRPNETGTPGSAGANYVSRIVLESCITIASLALILS